MPVTSKAKKQRVVIQCVTRTRAECLGTSFVNEAVETPLGTQASAGSGADPNVAIFGPPFSWGLSTQDHSSFSTSAGNATTTSGVLGMSLLRDPARNQRVL